MRGPPSEYAAPPVYVYPDRPGARAGIHFSRQELFQLSVAILALSAALTLAQFMSLRASIQPGALGVVVGFLFVGALVAVATGVGLHEIAHKIVAQRYGHWAEFRYNLRGLALAFVFAFFGFLIGAPGATMISGFVTREQNGRISAAGPVSNLLIGTGFLLGATAIARTMSTANLLELFVSLIFGEVFTINVILAGFNMIPILPFDGSKVWTWNKGAYVAILGLAIALYVTGHLLGVNAL